MGVKPTQAQRILALLRERGSQGATNYELMQISYQYPARLHTLRHKLGHEIEAKHIKDTEWRIKLIKDAAAKPVTPVIPAGETARTDQAALFDLPVAPRERRMFG